MLIISVKCVDLVLYIKKKDNTWNVLKSKRPYLMLS